MLVEQNGVCLCVDGSRKRIYLRARVQFHLGRQRWRNTASKQLSYLVVGFCLRKEVWLEEQNLSELSERE